VQTELTVLYDARCEFCRSVRAWLEGQPTYVRLHVLPAGSSVARARFPALDHAATLGEITVVRSDGAVYRGDNAYLVVLWALRRYRAWSLRLAEPGMRPHTRRALHWLTTNRSRLARAAWLCRLGIL
jgi:predicted DCC family thiol-disulfide oxidoreductase YuxK